MVQPGMDIKKKKLLKSLLQCTLYTLEILPALLTLLLLRDEALHDTVPSFWAKDREGKKV